MGCLAFQGTLLHTPSQPGHVEVLPDHLVVVNEDGVIVHLGPAGTSGNAALQAHGVQPSAVRVLGRQQFLLPGFIDTHTHAPQYQYCGVGTDLPLIGEHGWLSSYAFPTEASFRDPQHAQHVYSKCVARLLRLGTTTANYFTTIHVEGCKVLADVVQQAGQRAVLGKVCMDQHSPDFYSDSDAVTSVNEAREVVEYIQALQCSRLLPSVIPRFIPTCSQPLLQGLGQLAAAHDLHIHSHISESLDQVDFSLQLHPACSCDADIYCQAGLLTSKAIFAHGTQLTDAAMQLMAQHGAAVSHCPLSNFYFGDGLFGVAKALSLGLKVGLGTDIAGGYSPSMLQAQRMAVVNSHALKAAALMYGSWRQEEQQQGEEQHQQQQQQRRQQQQQQWEERQGMESLEQQKQQQQDGVRGSATVQSTSAGTDGTEARKRVEAVKSNPAVAAAAAAHMLTWEDALWLATAGGAAALALQDKVGHFAVGMEFDALLVDVGLAGGPVDVLDRQDDPLMLLEHFLNNGDDRNIVEVYVQGQRCV